MRLRFDTRVTNHGFNDGEATPFQSLLEAGTAVLVDNTGVPRVKCNCGNPLAEPKGLGGRQRVRGPRPRGVAQNPDEAWEGLDPAQAVKIEPGSGSRRSRSSTSTRAASSSGPSGPTGPASATPAPATSR